MAYSNQFGGGNSPYNVGSNDYSNMGSTWGMPGANMYTGAANTYQAPQQTFSDYTTPTNTDMSFMDSWNANGLKGIGDWGKGNGLLGSVDDKGMKTDGLLGQGLGAAQGVLGAYFGMKNYNLAKQSLAQGREQFDRNYAAQRTTTNASLEDRQRARVSSNASAYQSVGDYMNKNGIK